MQITQEQQKKYLTTEEKEKYLNGRRSKVVKNAIDKSGKLLPKEMIVSLHYSYITSLEIIKRKALDTDSSTSGSENNNKVQY